jgi:predicted nucleotidyltransferase component of viral defense system
MSYAVFLELFRQIYGPKKGTVVTSDDTFNLLREELQKLILKELYEMEEFRDIYFMGGTNLRISYGLERFSEDLDFAIDSKEAGASFDMEKILGSLARILKKR